MLRPRPDLGKMGGDDKTVVEDKTVVAKTNVIEMPRANDKVGRLYPWRRRELKST